MNLGKRLLATTTGPSASGEENIYFWKCLFCCLLPFVFLVNLDQFRFLEAKNITKSLKGIAERKKGKNVVQFLFLVSLLKSAKSVSSFSHASCLSVCLSFCLSEQEFFSHFNQRNFN